MIPHIGITLDHEPGGEGAYSRLPWFAVRENYCSSVAEAGGIPLPLPHQLELVDDYLELIDGLIVTGGAFDIPPSMYGESKVHAKVTTKDARTAFEWAMTQGALNAKKPILGICGGQQLLAVVLGGTLHQHIPDSVRDALEHEQKNPRDEPSHDVAITPNTLLHRIVGAATLSVNSAHHQAVDKLGPNVIVNAVAPDGVVEGIEYPAHPFCLGVQWHPEYAVSAGDHKIFQAFVAACRN